MTTDKKLGLERFQVSVATKQTLPALICQMQRAEIILHVKRVLLKHVIAIFKQSLNHRSLRKNRCIFRLRRLHTQLCALNIDFIAKHNFEQNLSSLHLLFDALISHSSTGVSPALLIK